MIGFICGIGIIVCNVCMIILIIINEIERDNLNKKE